MNLRFFAPIPLAAMLLAACSGRAAIQESAAPGANGTAESTAPLQSSPSAGTQNRAEGPASHEGDRAFAHVQQLAAAIGPRVAGTPGEQRAADYIASQFRSYGYAVETSTFEFTGDRFRAAALKAGAAELAAIAMDGSAEGPASGAAVFVGLADEAGINQRDLKGKIAVANRGVLTFTEKYQAVRAAGAIGLVILNNAEGQLNGRITERAPFPILGVAGEDAGNVRLAALAGDKFELITSGNGPSKGINVIARGFPGAACDIVVGGHYDTVPAAPGANDNASGTANVIELARAMAADGIDRGLCFASFSAEESGLFGSEAFVSQLKGEGRLPKAMVNMDVTGIGSGVDLIGDPGLVNSALGLAKGLNIDAKRSSLPANTGSDHQSFQKAGVASIWFYSGDFPTIHSPRDITADIDSAELDRAGDLAYALLTQLLREVAHG